MRILIFSQYYPPEAGATQNRVSHFARKLAAAGHDVAVVAEVPNHPKGVVFDGYRGMRLHRSYEDGIDTLRVWVYTSPRKSFLRRLAFYLSYSIHSTFTALTTGLRPDVVLASSPPLPVLLAAYGVSRARRCPLVLDIRDIWPAVGVALGELRGRWAYETAARVERFLYRRAAAITCVTHGFVDHVVANGADPLRVHFVPNGTMPDVFRPDRRDERLRGSLALEGKFVIGYLGNHGIAQGLPAVLAAARRLANRPDVHFLFVGEGPVKADLAADARQDRLGNVTFHPEVPVKRVTEFINVCDLCLVPLRDLDILGTFVPSKMFDYLACEKPVVLMVDGEARAILEQSGGGVFVPPEDDAALAETILELRGDRGRLGMMGRRGREYVVARYNRDDQATRLEAILAEVSNS